jgi:hypothetical protein
LPGVCGNGGRVAHVGEGGDVGERALEAQPEACVRHAGYLPKDVRYSASGVGFSGGGSIPNVLAVMQVIEKLPVDATSATRLVSPSVFSAAA